MFQKPTKSRSLILLLLVNLIIWSCSKNDIDPVVENQYLVSTSVIGEYSTTQVAQRVDNSDFGQGNALITSLVKGLVKYPIKVYKVVYNTKGVDGKTLQASGVVIVPTTTESLPLISQQHGTLSNKADAPSLYSTGASETYLLASLVASNGFILSCPDYIGYGTTQNLDHPYEHRETLAQSSLDLIRAAKELLNQEKVSWSKKVMITGYSEGGYATMALQKKMEEQFPNEFNLVASSCGAGAYNKTAFMKYIINETTHGVASYNSLYIWVTTAYNSIYGINRPMTYYFNAPYAAEVQAKGPFANIPVSINLAYSDTFRKGVNEGTDTAFINAVKDNDIFDWKPKTPTQLYHGTADQHVFYFNSETAFNAMKAKGGDVTLISLPNKDHFTAIQDYLLGTLTFFGGKK
ncbi:alpha/beta hydrolase family protein [Flectobacillus major]|uniref:alpha/beta hydrolase family protein n=1 Tax=Flectobacillus major TaxID=103 RepID=UPI00040B7FD6|nr:lipase family protein [Flectobacillus major]